MASLPREPPRPRQEMGLGAGRMGALTVPWAPSVAHPLTPSLEAASVHPPGAGHRPGSLTSVWGEPGAWACVGLELNNHRGCAYQSLSCCPDLVLSQRQVGTPCTPATPDPMTALAFVLGTACCPSRPLTKAPPIPASMRGLPGPSWGTCRRLRGFGALWLPSWGDGRVDPQQFPARQREGGAPGKQGQAGAAPGWA